LSTWQTWIACLKAGYGLQLGPDDAAAFAAVSGGRAAPARKVRRFVAAASRRSAKSRIAAAKLVFEACLVDHSRHLAPGETGVCAAISPTRSQARVIKDYAKGFISQSPVLRDMIEEVTQDEIRLNNGIVITTLSSDYRTLRGRTLLECAFDEAAFLRDGSSAASDIETARALEPALATTGGMLTILSSPYRKVGLLYQLHRDYFGRSDDDTLVVAGPSVLFNPTLNKELIAKAHELDAESARSEWDGEFRSDLSGFLDDLSIDDAIDHARPLELPPRDGFDYWCFVDMSGGRADLSTCCVSHLEGERVVIDVILGRAGDPAAATEEYAALAKSYRCTRITGDNYGADLVAGPYRECGVEYAVSPLVRSEIYLATLPTWTRGLVSMPNHAVTIRELRMLERKVARSGRDSVNHPPGQHDDHANSLCGSIYLAMSALQQPRSRWTICDPAFQKYLDGASHIQSWDDLYRETVR
jgi:hypothetical protein